MRLIIVNTSQFFTVVGPPYIAERRADGDLPRQGSYRRSNEIAFLSAPCSAGSWLNDDR
jgi:hypothetical protein